MSAEQVELVRRCWEGLNEKPPRVFYELLDEEVEIRNPPEFPLTGPFRGHEGVRQWASDVWEVVTGLHFEVEEIVESGDGERVVSVQRTQGRIRHTGLKTDIEWAAVWTFREGRILRAQGYLEKARAFEAAGLGE